MFKVGDEVYYRGNEKKVGTVKTIVDDIAVVQFGAIREKVPLHLLIRSDSFKVITPEKYDEAVKALMYEVAEDVGDTAQLDGVLEIVGLVCTRLKARIF